MSTFDIRDGRFFYDGHPTRLISGAIHYFRVVPGYWRDRLLKLKLCGFNTVETYVAWNVHEPTPGTYDFEGMANIECFINMAGELGLHVVVRPSPYICAEWEFGGLPAWLLSDPNAHIRCYDPSFLHHVDAFYDVLMPKLRPLLCTHGGPIIAMQIENEYGSYGNDKRYLQHLRESMVNRGIDVLLFTSDGPEERLFQGGMIDGLLETVNFGSRPSEAFAKLLKQQPNAPLMCSEYWNGWFDHWGSQHHTRAPSDVAQELEEMLKAGASVNFYMFHGGTNFGFFNGANCDEKYEPTVTSYDYDAPLDETGRPTDKYFAIREVIAKYTPLDNLPMPADPKTKAYGQIPCMEHAPLFDVLPLLSHPVRRTCPETMEQLGQNYGFILYTTRIAGPEEDVDLVIQSVRDRAMVFLNGTYTGVVDRNTHPQRLRLMVPPQGAELRLLVENMGRVNYGPFLMDRKGILEGVRIGNQFLFDWTIHTLPLNDLNKLQFCRISDTSNTDPTPTFYRATFQVNELADTFLDVGNWTKGVAFVNGFNLGRYWNIGPQETMYIPAPLLHPGENEIVMFELHGTTRPAVTLGDTHRIG